MFVGSWQGAQGNIEENGISQTKPKSFSKYDIYSRYNYYKQYARKFKYLTLQFKGDSYSPA